MMRVALAEVEERRRRLASMIQLRGYVPVGELCKQFQISEATARRDLAVLEREQKITRTFGGALVDFNTKFPSFQQRQKEQAAGKERIARAAHRLLRPGSRVFFDAGTTLFRVAEMLRDHPVKPLTVVTYSLPVAEMLAGVESVDVYLLGGQLLIRQSLLLGEMTCHALTLWHFDLALMGARALDRSGTWNTPPEVMPLQREVISRSVRTVFCIDASKIGHAGPHFFFRWSPNYELLTNASPERIAKAGIRLRKKSLLDLSPGRAS